MTESNEEKGSTVVLHYADGREHRLLLKEASIEEAENRMKDAATGCRWLPVKWPPDSSRVFNMNLVEHYEVIPGIHPADGTD